MSEQVLRFGAWRSLIGVLTEPDAGTAVADAPAMLFLNSGLVHHVGPNRLHVNLARQLARAGVLSLRFDVSGIGDSGVRQDRIGREESMVIETREAMDTLAASHGVQRFVLFGICTGADQAVRTALADPRVVGAVLVDGYSYRTSSHYLHYYLGRALRPRSWWNLLSLRHPAFARWAARLRGRASAAPAAPREAPPGPRPGIYIKPAQAEAEARLAALLARGCRLCFVFTSTATFSHAAQFGDMFPSLRRHPGLRVVFLKDCNHVFTLLASQKAIMLAVESWFTASFRAAPRPDDSARRVPAASSS